MNKVLEIKRRHEDQDMGALLRAIAPAARRNQEARRRREQRVRRVNVWLARAGVPLRVV